MIQKIINSIEGQKITILEWFIAFIGIIFIRFFLEFFSNPSPYGGSITSDSSTLVHYGLFFLATLFGLMIITWFFSGKRSGVINLFLFGLPIIWLSPIIDIVFSGGKGFVMTYVLDNGKQLLFDFLTYFGPNIYRGATIGIRVEVFFILFGIGLYVWNSRKKIFPTLTAVILSYFFVFCLFSIPGVLYTVSHPFVSGNSIETVGFMERSIVNSNINQNIQDGMMTYKTYPLFLEFGFNKLMSQVFFVLMIFFVWLWFWLTEKEKLKVILKNSRPERVLFYTILFCVGAFFAYLNGFGHLNLWVDGMSFIILIIAWYGGWVFAVHTNDIADVEIDAISNPHRPITDGKLTSDMMHNTSLTWLAISLIGSFIVGYYPFFMNLIFIATYYIYSAPPLRFKRIPIFSSFLIGVACLSTILSGFFFVSSNKDFSIFPTFVALGILFIFTLAVNVRDMKDVLGDSMAGIKTLPVIFGKYGGQVVGVLFAISFLLVPLVTSFSVLYVVAIPSSFFAYKIATKKPYKEKYVFILFFIFIIFSGILIGGLYQFSKYYPTKSTVVNINNKIYKVYIADTPILQERGLSGRLSLGEKEGMLFVFATSSKYGFWMKNMNFPIDIVWISDTYKVVSLKQFLATSTYPMVFYPISPAMYVLEISAGQSDQLGLKIGDIIKIQK